MIQELLYTSHRGEGLRQGSGGGFCTVLCTHGMAPNIVRRLEQMSGYTHPFDVHDKRSLDNPVLFRSREISIGGIRYVVLSRIADLRAEHSGRSNKLAHHLLLTEDEFVSSGPAAVMSRSTATIREFNGVVKEVAPKPSVMLSATPFRGPCNAWNKLAGDAGWAGAIADRLQKSGSEGYVKVIFPLGADCIALVDEVFALLPEDKRWSISFSTFATGSTDPDKLEFILDGTQAATMLRRDRRKFVVDVAETLNPPEASPYVAAARSGDYSQIQASKNRQRLPTVTAKSDLTNGKDEEFVDIEVIDLEPAPPNLHRSHEKSNDASEDEFVDISLVGKQPSRWLQIGIVVGSLLALCAILMAVMEIGFWFSPKQTADAEPEQQQVETEEVVVANNAPEPEVLNSADHRGTEDPQNPEALKATATTDDALVMADEQNKESADDLHEDASGDPEHQIEKEVPEEEGPAKEFKVVEGVNIPWTFEGEKPWAENSMGKKTTEEITVLAHFNLHPESTLELSLDMKSLNIVNVDLRGSKPSPENAEASSYWFDFEEVDARSWFLQFVQSDGTAPIRVARIFVDPDFSDELRFEWLNGANNYEMQLDELRFIQFLEFDVKWGGRHTHLQLRNAPFEFTYGKIKEANQILAMMAEVFVEDGVTFEFQPGDGQWKAGETGKHFIEFKRDIEITEDVVISLKPKKEKSALAIPFRPKLRYRVKKMPPGRLQLNAAKFEDNLLSIAEFATHPDYQVQARKIKRHIELLTEDQNMPQQDGAQEPNPSDPPRAILDTISSEFTTLQEQLAKPSEHHANLKVIFLLNGKRELLVVEDKEPESSGSKSERPENDSGNKKTNKQTATATAAELDIEDPPH